MSKSISPLLLIGGGVAIYLLARPSSPSGVSPITQTLASFLPGATTTTSQVPTTYGINNGTGVVANYAQLAQANQNLLNPNYQMTPEENAQYLANYTDLQQGLPLWIGKKDLRGVTCTNISQAAQEHWSIYGCAEKRIFLPLQPPSYKPYTPPPPAAKTSGSGGSSVVTDVLKVATTILPFILGETNNEPQLNDADAQVLFTGAAILYDILPLYAANDPQLTGLMKNKLDQLLKQYA